MRKRDEALALLHEGLNPIQIEREQGVSLGTIFQYTDACSFRLSGRTKSQ
jgi:hypothetical protein